MWYLQVMDSRELGHTWEGTKAETEEEGGFSGKEVAGIVHGWQHRDSCSGRSFVWTGREESEGRQVESPQVQVEQAVSHESPSSDVQSKDRCRDHHSSCRDRGSPRHRSKRRHSPDTIAEVITPAQHQLRAGPRLDEQTQQVPASHAHPAGVAGPSQSDSAETFPADDEHPRQMYDLPQMDEARRMETAQAHQVPAQAVEPADDSDMSNDSLVTLLPSIPKIFNQAHDEYGSMEGRHTRHASRAGNCIISQNGG